ncbi:MAG: hypothetical protein KDE48_09800 [Anaerolineales bacterium]|nr:hypothetical protein [Anaerolineales bacterium]
MIEEPELIEIIEGPTPEFHPSPQVWLQSLQEGPDIRDVVLCQLRTGSGKDIQERCKNAWEQGRPVRLDFPDDLRMRQQVDVVALRLSEVEEGELLTLWVSLPVDYEIIAEDGFDDDDEEDDDDSMFLF